MTSAKSEPIEVLETLQRERYSCRAFKSDPVSSDIIERILNSAQRTASWCNSQPWQLIVTSGAETKALSEKLVAAAKQREPNTTEFPFPAEYRGVYDARRKESGFQLYNSLGIPRGDKEAYAKQMGQNFHFFGAPHVAIITTDETLGVYGLVDCGGYIANFMLAAQALGIGAIAQAALATKAAIIREHFQIAPDRKIVCGISFGYADHAHKANDFRTSRAALPEAVQFVG